MRKVIITLAAAGVLAMASATSVFAASANHTQPGTPGTPNCAGQTLAFLAQGVGGYIGTNGIGGFASASGYSVQDVQALVREYCAGE